MTYIILGLGAYFFPVNALPNQKRAIRCVTRKLHGLKVRCHSSSLVVLNEYLVVLPGKKISDNIYVTEINKILLNSMPNIWIKQAYVQGSDCGYITLKLVVDMYERIKIAEYIYKGVVEPSYKTY